VGYFLSVVIYFILSYFRSSEIITQGRFFAEEGSVYWSYALSNSAFNLIQYVPVIQGYICFNCNLQIYLSTFVPTHFAPLVTVWTSLFISLLPSFFFLKLTEKVYKKEFRVLASITILFLPSLNLLEVFANSINSQVYLAISCFIILLYGLKDKKLLKTQYTVLLISFFSTYYSLAFLPFFVIRLFREKTKSLFYALLFGTFGTVVQLNILYYVYSTDSIYKGKLQLKGGFDYLFEIIKLSLTLNFMGEKNYRSNLGTVIFFILIISILFFMSKNIDFIYRTIIASFFFQVFLIYFGQAGNSYSQRYAVVPTTVIFFLFIHHIGKKNLLNKYILFFLFIGILNFQTQGGTYFVDCGEHCVTWEIQVDKVNNGEIDKYVHWPMGKGDPYWFTDAKNPQPNPAPFQKEIIGENFKDLYSLTLSEVVKKNILNLKSN
jgi:hypothetical protein